MIPGLLHLLKLGSARAVKLRLSGVPKLSLETADCEPPPRIPSHRPWIPTRAQTC